MDLASREDVALPSQADALVIGAGAFGFATAYHLAQFGAGSVVLIDQYEPGTQVSPRAAGLFKMIQSSDATTRLAQLSRRIVTTFGEETGVPIPHVRSGSLFLAQSPLHASMVDAEVEDSRGWGVEIERIDPREASRLCPYVEADDFRAVYHIPEDFYIEEPRAMLMAYWQAGMALGMQVIGHTPVTGILVEGGRVSGVETPRGTITAPVVVDAAGVWARRVGAMASVDVEIIPVRHQLRITAPIDSVSESMPIIRVPDLAAYARPARGGLMYGGFEADPAVVETIPETGFTLDMVRMDPGLPDQFRETLEPIVPVLRGSTSQEDRGGLFTMTADGRLLAGPATATPGFWVATGCNGSGFSLSSAVGASLAEWIVGGQPAVDMSPFDPDRFGPEALTPQSLRERSVWQYANYYTPRA
jgi:glycine/D-amino acid oxidase-like deaminating enzyme